MPQDPSSAEINGRDFPAGAVGARLRPAGDVFGLRVRAGFERMHRLDSDPRGAT